MTGPPAGRVVALVGFMGAGKTAVGRALAALWGRPFVDLDEAVRRRTGRSAAAWIREEGEEPFRAREAAVLDAVLEEGAASDAQPVIACGGGAFCREAVRSRLLEAALCVWLDVPLEAALERAGESGEDRPLLERDRSALRRLYEARRPRYAEAHIRVPAGSGDAAAVAAEAARRIGAWEARDR